MVYVAVLILQIQAAALSEYECMEYIYQDLSHIEREWAHVAVFVSENSMWGFEHFHGKDGLSVYL